MESVRRAGEGGSKQVPAISLEIQEDRDLPVCLDACGGDESDARGCHPRVCRFEIIDAQEEPDSAGELLAHGGRLTLAIGAREQKARTAAAWANDDPSLRPAIVRQRWNVLDQLELQDIDEEIDCRFVLAHDQGDEVEMRHQFCTIPKKRRSPVGNVEPLVEEVIGDRSPDSIPSRR